MSDSGDQADKSVNGAGPRVREIPDGDDRPRLVCPDCGFIKYDNPLMVVGAVVRSDEKVLLCRRAIEPRRGFWTIPAGYLELHEDAATGAKRETREEACAEIEIDALMAVYSIPRISQIQLIYRATLIGEAYAPGPESLDVALFDWSNIPWDEIAFPSVHWALNHNRDIGDAALFPVHANPPGETGNF